MGNSGKAGKYRTARAFETAVNEYFASISRTVTASEEYDTGEVTAKGAPVSARRPVLNDRGGEIRYTEYVVPPTLSALRLNLGITAAQWAELCDPARRGGFSAVAERATARIESFLEGELVRSRGATGVQGALAMLRAENAARRDVTARDDPSLTFAEKLAIIKEAARRYAAAGENDE